MLINLPNSVSISLLVLHSSNIGKVVFRKLILERIHETIAHTTLLLSVVPDPHCNSIKYLGAFYEIKIGREYIFSSLMYM